VDRSTPTITTATRKLYPLTSLRFFAAAIVVLHHSRGYFGFSATAWPAFNLAQGVSFFFVLSGFILTYVYPSLKRVGVCRFWLARVARIWPAHALAFLLLFVLLPVSFRSFAAPHGYNFYTAILNLSLVHAWIPDLQYIFSFNSVTWSLSVEMGFYLLFPLLIRTFRRTWALQLGITLTVVLGIVRLSDTAHLLALLSTPLMRMFEFVLGMTAALAWQCVGSKLRVGRRMGTVMEVGALTLVLLVMSHSVVWGARLGQYRWIGLNGDLWLIYAGFTCMPFAVLIFVMALEQGWISRLLALPLLVVLGEISYSVYLLHAVLLSYYLSHPLVFAPLPDRVAYFAFWLVILVAAYVVWSLVELPSRRFLVRLWPRRSTAGETTTAVTALASKPSFVTPTWRRGLSGGVLLLIPIAYAIYFAAPALDHITQTDQGVKYAINCLGMNCLAGEGIAHTESVTIASHQFPGGLILVSGYAVDSYHHQLVRGVYLSVDDLLDVPATSGIPHAEYAALLGDPRYERAGYAGYIAINQLSPGNHSITLKVLNWGATTYFESPRFVFTVTA